MLRMISDLDDKTFTKFLKNSFSNKSKRFLVQIKREAVSKGIDLNIAAIKAALIEFILNMDITKNEFLNLFLENKHMDADSFDRLLTEMIYGLKALNASGQKVKKNELQKKEHFENIRRNIEGTLIHFDRTFESIEPFKQIRSQLDNLIIYNLTLEKKFELKSKVTVNNIVRMLNKLAKDKRISEDFKVRKTQFIWIYRAFYFSEHTNFLSDHLNTKLNFSKYNELADWLLQLKTYYIRYNGNDNKELLDWVIDHITIKGKEFERSSINYESLKRNLRNRKDLVSKFIF